MDLISVIMPTLNVVQYIEEAVESILNQTWKDLELIIVDDCSQDGTYELVKSKYSNDDRVRIYRNDTNQKICKTLNRAFRESKGSYIARMDGDDISERERIAVLKQYLDEHPDIDLVGSQVVSIDEEGRFLSNKSYLKTNSFINKGNKFGPSLAHIWLARKRVYEELGGYRDIPYAEDYDFLLRGELKGFKYANVDDYLYKVRIRQGNTGSSNGLRQRKAKELVRQLYLKEKADSGSSDFNEQVYDIATAISERELKKYSKAHDHLERAIHNRNNPIKVFLNTMIAAIESKYMFRYLFDAAMMRLLIQIERKKHK